MYYDCFESCPPKKIFAFEHVIHALHLIISQLGLEGLCHPVSELLPPCVRTRGGALAIFSPESLFGGSIPWPPLKPP